MNQEKIGEFIKKIRIDNNLTQKDFASELGVTFQAVSKWENGKNIPDVEVLKIISEKFNVSVDEIINGKKQTNKKNNKIIYSMLLLIIIIVMGILYIFKNTNPDFEFKHLSTTCENFTLNGTVAYTKNKSSIYISNIDYCGTKDEEVYDTLECFLMENYKDTDIKVRTCDKAKNKSLEDYISAIKIDVDNYKSSCKIFKESELYIKINATKDKKTMTYSIPIELNDNCN